MAATPEPWRVRAYLTGRPETDFRRGGWYLTPTATGGHWEFVPWPYNVELQSTGQAPEDDSR